MRQKGRGWGPGRGYRHLPRKFLKILGKKIMHFHAKFSLVLRCIRSVGEGQLLPTSPSESATVSIRSVELDCSAASTVQIVRKVY